MNYETEEDILSRYEIKELARQGLYSTKTQFARERSEAAGGSPQTSPASRAPPGN